MKFCLIEKLADNTETINSVYLCDKQLDIEILKMEYIDEVSHFVNKIKEELSDEKYNEEIGLGPELFLENNSMDFPTWIYKKHGAQQIPFEVFVF